VRQREAALEGLLRSGLLKRFESCWAACLRTVERMLVAHDVFLGAWDERGLVPSNDALREAARLELDDAGIAEAVLDMIENDQGARSVDAFVAEFRDHVAQDREILDRLRTRLIGLTSRTDPKLQLLIWLFVSKRGPRRDRVAGRGCAVNA
jgi:hypothetical protein